VGIEIQGFELEEFKAMSEDGEFEGYASVFSNVDSGGDMVLPGAFKKSLKKTKGRVPILANHITRKQIGWGLNAREDAKGLWVHGQLNLEVEEARTKYALAKQAAKIKAKTGLSIGYNTLKREWDGEVRKLKEVELWEYSLLPFPMNDHARVTAIKGGHLVLASGDEFDDVRSFERFLRDAGCPKAHAVHLATKAFSGQSDSDVKEVLGAIDKVALILST
jgi:hypothetical protein